LCATLASCFPSYGIGSADAGAADGGGGEAGRDAGSDATVDGPPDAPADVPHEAIADSGPGDAADSSSPLRDGGTIAPSPYCGDMSGLEANAPWPMYGYCPAQRRRSPLPGPGMTRPTVKWSKMIQPDPQFSPLVTASGLVIAASTGGASSAMTAYDLNGAYQWRWTPPTGDSIQWSPAIGADDVIYVPCAGSVYGVGLDGGQRWASSSSNGTRSPILVGPGPVLYVDTPTAALWSLLSDGGDNWPPAAIPPGVDNQFPMFGVPEAGLTIFQGANNASLWTVTTSGTASQLWPGVDSGSSNATLHVIAAPDGNIRVSNQSDDHLYSLTPSGQLVWSWPQTGAGDPGIPRVPGIGDDSTTFIGHQGGAVVAVDSSGQQRWTTTGTADPTPLCNSVTIDANGIVYTGCQKGLHAYDPTTGTRYWEMNPSSSTGLDYGISIGWNGTLYVTCSDGYLYAVAP
jgi:hypothetical protein